mgnify:CR=1 FL=1
MSKWYVTECCMAPIQSGKCLKCGQDAKFKAMQFVLKETKPRPARLHLWLNLLMVLASLYLTFTLVKIIY